MMPLSEEERCRLCLSTSANASPSQSSSSSKNFVNLFDQNDRPHLVVDKLRQFVNLNIHPQDKNYCSNRVCRSCVMNLDFCIQYVDRCRRINELMLQGENPDNIVATVTSHYPYLYKSSDNIMSNNMPGACQNENPQTVPFQMGQFFGPTADFIVPEGNNIEAHQNTNTDGDTNVEPMKYAKDTMDNMVIEVEPNAILRPNATHNFKRNATDFDGSATADQNSIRSKKMRKILPKQLSISGDQTQLCHPSNAVKTSNGLFMMPVTIVTQCKTCKASIKANNVTDIQDHVCFDSARMNKKNQQSKGITCTEKGCNKKFYAQVTLRYHLKHYHGLGKNTLKSKIIASCADQLVHHQDPELSATENDEIVSISQKNNNDNKDCGNAYSTEEIGKKLFRCTWPNCEKAYSAKNFLIEHIRTHTGDRPYACSNCDKTFSRILDVKKHQLLKVCQ